MHSWLQLSYKIPPGPTARRVYVWRKLKRLGALLVLDAAWVLPATPRTREQFQWLAAEIGEMGGEAALWESRALQPGQDEALVRQFLAQADAAYAAILAELEQEGADPGLLARRYQQVQAQDYFGSELGRRVRAALIAARGGNRL